jgi:hypothetical protein
MSRTCTFVAAAFLAVLPTTSAHAQIGLGLMAGGSLSNVSGDLPDNTKQALTFVVGGFLHLDVAGFGLNPGLLFARKGFKAPPEGGVTPKATFDYLQVPVVFRIGMPAGNSGRFYIGVGPAIGFKLGCRLSASSGGVSASTDCEDLDLGGGATLGLKSTEISGIGEVGLEFGKLAIGIRADLGLDNIFKVSSGVISVTPDIKTRTISAVVAYRF